jgi:hypothetical protein
MDVLLCVACFHQELLAAWCAALHCAQCVYASPPYLMLISTAQDVVKFCMPTTSGIEHRV